jgi:hypothetical protein
VGSPALSATYLKQIVVPQAYPEPNEKPEELVDRPIDRLGLIEAAALLFLRPDVVNRWCARRSE